MDAQSRMPKNADGYCVATDVPCHTNAVDVRNHFKYDMGKVERIVVLGDLHYTESADSERAALWRTDGIPRILAAAGCVARDSGAALALQIGDLVSGEEADGATAHEALISRAMHRLESALSGVELAVVPGNHDRCGKGGSEAWTHVVSPVNISIALGDDALVLLDSNAPDETFAALPRLITETTNCRRLFVALHHPVIPCYYGLSYRSIFLGEPERDAERMEALRLLARRHAIVLCGHVHTNGFIDWRDEDGGRIVQLHFSSLWDGGEPSLRPVYASPDEYGRSFEREGRTDAALFFAPFRKGLAAYRHFDGAGFALVESNPNMVSVSLFGGGVSDNPSLTVTI